MRETEKGYAFFRILLDIDKKAGFTVYPDYYSVGFAHNPNQEEQEIVYNLQVHQIYVGFGQRQCYGSKILVFYQDFRL